MRDNETLQSYLLFPIFREMRKIKKSDWNYWKNKPLRTRYNWNLVICCLCNQDVRMKDHYYTAGKYKAHYLCVNSLRPDYKASVDDSK